MLQKIAGYLLVAFLLSNMLSSGMRLSFREVVAPLRNRRLTIKALVANFAIVPLVALAIVSIVPMERSYAVGLLLLGSAAGDPSVVIFSKAAKGDAAYAVGMMIILQVVTVIFMPLVLPQLLSGVSVDAMSIAKPLIMLMLLPLAIGFALRALLRTVAERIRQPIDRFSTFALAAYLVLFNVEHWHETVNAIGSGVFALALLFTWIAFFAGFFLGGPKPTTRSDLAQQTSTRNVSAAFMVGHLHFGNQPGVVVFCLIYVVAGLSTTLIAATTWLRRRNTRARTTAAPPSARAAA